MNFKTTIILAFLVVIVGLYILFVQQGAESPIAPDAQVDMNINGLPIFEQDLITSDSVDRMTITRGDTTLVIEHGHDDTWWMTSPIRFELTPWQVKRLANTAGTLRYFEKFKPGGQGVPTLSELELDPPVAAITYDTGEQSRTIHLGKQAISGRGYIRIDDQPEIYVTTSTLHKPLIEEKFTDWRKKSIQSPDAEAVNRITLRRDDAVYDMTRIEGQWYLDQNATQRADAAAVKQLVNDVGSIYISKFIEDDPDDLSLYGLAEPVIEVTYHLPIPPRETEEEADNDAGDQAANDEKSELEDELSKPEPDTYILRIGAQSEFKEDSPCFATWTAVSSDDDQAQHTQVVFTIPYTAVEKFRKEIDTFRDKAVLPIDTGKVSEIRVDRPESQSIHLIRKSDGDFIFGRPDPGYGVGYQAANKLINTTGRAEAQSFKPDFSPVVEPLAIVTIKLAGSDKSEILTVFPSNSDDAYLALREGETVAARVKASQFEPLFMPLLKYRDPVVIDLDPGRLESAVLKREDYPAMTFVSRKPSEAEETEPDTDQNNWRLEGYDRFEADDFKRLLYMFSPLRAGEWLADETEVGWKAMTLSLTRQDGEVLTLRVDPESLRATITGVDMMFKVSDSLKAMLNQEYRYRTICPFTHDQIDSVAVIRDDDTITITRSDSDEYEADTHEPVDQEAAAGLFDTLAGLRVERYIEKGDAQPERVITVNTSDGQAITLLIPAYPGDTTTGVIGDIAFKLNETDADKLKAEFIEQDVDITK